nr:endonuclease VIII [Clostridia bacterium]
EGMMNDNRYYMGGLEKPSPLSDAFDAPYFEGLLSGVKPTLSAKAFLATEQRIPGLGNGVLQDILLRAGIHPMRALSTLGDADTERLYDSVKGVLRQMTDDGGRDTESDLLGNPGGYRTLLSRKTWGHPCLLCGASLENRQYLGGKIYYCPACQPLS